MGVEMLAGELPELEVVATTSSTNDDVMALARAGAPHGACVAAHEQTAGRGRRGHGWGSPASGLYLSVLLRPEVPMSHLMGLSAVCALGLVEALRETGATTAQLKWPNDVVVPGEAGAAKLCGLLMEAGMSDLGMFAVAGMGVNLERPELEGDMGSVSPLPAASLAETLAAADAEMPAFEALAEAIRAHVVARTNEWAEAIAAGRGAAGPLAPVLSDYFDALYLMGEPVNVVYPNGNLMAQGTFVGVDVWGRAAVRLEGGKELSISSEQASLRARE